MEIIFSTDAVLPGRQRIDSTTLEKSWNSRHFSLNSEKNWTHLSDTATFS
jgi:hypothetical protein